MPRESANGESGPEEFEPLLDSQQAANLMGVHPETIKRRARRGELPGIKLGKVWRFRASGLNAYIRELAH